MAQDTSCECNRKLKGLLSRRQALQSSGLGFGSLALAFLMKDQLWAATITPNAGPAAGVLYNDLKARQGHFRGQAKAVIQLFQTGGPSQIDLFDPKPELTKRSGERHPQCLKTDFADPSGDDKAPSILFGSPFKFKRYGKCGMELSEIIPQSRGQSSEHA